MVGILSGFILVVILAVIFGISALAFLVLLCPLMMIAMMFGMNNNHKR
ncbi:DUF2933 domain-containing protein [Candidatus Saccharibacteria bacterium]|nr:DUF2933 domain-containing protein [Candidatus Saccharibacteria bacterium]